MWIAKKEGEVEINPMATQLQDQEAKFLLFEQSDWSLIWGTRDIEEWQKQCGNC